MGWTDRVPRNTVQIALLGGTSGGIGGAVATQFEGPAAYAVVAVVSVAAMAVLLVGRTLVLGTDGSRAT